MGSTESTARGPDSTLWHRLTDPAPLISDPAERRTARLLSTVLLITAPLGFVAVAGQIIEAGALEDQHAVAMAAVATTLLSYLLSRTSFFEWAAVITVLVPTVTGLGVLNADPSDPGWFAFMGLSPVFGSMFLLRRQAVLLAGVNLLGVVAGVLMTSELDATTSLLAVVFNAMITAVLLTARHHRDQLEDDRRHELLARRRLNERIFEGTFGGIGLHRDGCIVQANEQFADLFGRSGQDLRGSQLEELFAFEARPALESLLASASGETRELVAVRGDGSALEVEVVVPPGASIDDEAHLLAVRDISERKLAADALVQAQRMESVGRLAAGIAHDTNNLLAVILIRSERLRDERAEAGLGTVAEESIHDAARQIAILLGRLQLADRGRVDEPVKIDLRSFIAAREPMWRQLVDDQIEIEIQAGDGVGKVLVDPTNLEQAMLNLVLNARDAMPSGGHLVVALDGIEIDGDDPSGAGELDPGSYQRVRVTDTGIGIMTEHLDRIFEPFFTTKKPEVGTGIGLYTSREVIEGAGGTLTAEVEPGCTTFLLLLPDAS
ncbi:MAG: PAS domain S-box protein [Actinomycetia bacterium]|nr:PAS domain S-box protein [Actinomycetes bacterium]